MNFVTETIQSTTASGLESTLSNHNDGDIICYKGIDMVRSGNKVLGLGVLLAWPGLEEELKKLPQIDLPVNHTFSGGVYIREMHIPKGIFIIGKRHRHETCNILLKGTLSVFLDDGKNRPVSKVSGPLILTSEPMTRKIAFCHEDAVFLNIHPTEERDLDKIESHFIISEQEFLAYKGDAKCLGVA